MITAVDTNVLLDAFLPDERQSPASGRLLRVAYDAGDVVVCDVVYAELAAAFDNQAGMDEVLLEINVTTSPLDTEVAFLAGRRWLEYRRAGGLRDRIITDFPIGTHALLRADRFLTRDRGFYQTYFVDLKRLEE